MSSSPSKTCRLQRICSRLPAAFALALIVLQALLLAECRTYNRLRNPVEMDGRSPKFLSYKDVFSVYYDPQIPKEELQDSLERGYREWSLLRRNFFSSDKFPKKEIHIVVYRDKESYNRHAGNLPKSLARFDRRTNRIYLTLQTGSPAWRHELVHALLDGIRPSSYRVQEGLAWFLQYQKFSSNVDCRSAQTARPVPFASILPQIHAQPMPLDEFFGSRRRSMEDLTFLARSAYYMQFVWSKGALKKSLDYYLKHPHSYFEYELTRADRIRLKKLYAEFHRWLRSSAPLRKTPGC